VPEEVSPRSPTPQKIWDDYNYETIDLSVPEATDILEEQLRMKYLYELEMKHEVNYKFIPEGTNQCSKVRVI
jgi:hypothetical protein